MKDMIIRSVVQLLDAEKPEILVHAASDHASGNYDTLCGMDLDDPDIGHYSSPAKKGDKINCVAC